MCQSCNDLYTIAPNLWNTGITTAVCNNLKNNTGVTTNTNRDNCQDLDLMMDCLSNRYIGKLASADPCNWGEYLGDFLKAFSIVGNALVCNECGQWTNINELWIEINKIWEAIRDISLGGQYSSLRRGVDFVGQMYNGFYTPPDVHPYLILEYYSVQDIYYFRLRANASNYAMKLLDPHQVWMLHASDAADYPNSWIFSWDFIGDFAFLQSYTQYVSLSSSAGTGIWNVNPQSARARWQAVTNTFVDVAGCPNKFVQVLSSYADGYNTQFTVYPTLAGVETNNLNLIHTFALLP